MQQQRGVRTRYAPSPTGFQHIGGIRTALYCYLFTRKMGGQFILRIEDTDQSRTVPGVEDYIVEALNWCQITCDEGVHLPGGPCEPYRQSERKAIYAQYAQQLINTGHAYYAFDTEADLDEMRQRLANAKADQQHYTRETMTNSLTLPPHEVAQRLANNQPFVIRLKVPKNTQVLVNDLVRGEVVVHSSEIDDAILLKSDGMPTYHLANVVDDYLMGITHVIRGEEWLPSTPKHVLLYEAFGWKDKMPQFAHLPLLLKPDGNGKLSKRDGDRLGFPVFPLAWQHPLTPDSSTGYREMGFFPEAFVNMLAFLGWNPGTEQEIFSMDELVAAFSLENVSKSGAKFSFDKAKWFNEQYLRAKNPDELAAFAAPFAPEKFKTVNTDYLTSAFALMKERLTFAPQIFTEAAYLFEPPQNYDRATVAKKWKPELSPAFAQLIAEFANIENTGFTASNLEQTTKSLMAAQSLKPGDLLPLLRIALTGTTAGPAVFDTAALLGQTETTSRLITGLALFENSK